jgi:hypothetical protein
MTAVTFVSPYHRPAFRVAVPAAEREPGADYESLCAYATGETAAFPNDEAAWLIAHGIATPAVPTTNGGTTERTDV